MNTFLPNVFAGFGGMPLSFQEGMVDLAANSPGAAFQYGLAVEALNEAASGPDRRFLGEPIQPAGDRILFPPLFRPSQDYSHRKIPLELLGVVKEPEAAPLAQGAQLMLGMETEGAARFGERMGEIQLNSAEGERTFRRIGVEELIRDVEQAFRSDNTGYFSGADFQRALQDLTSDERLRVARQVETFLGELRWDIRQAAVRVLEKITPHLEEKDRLKLALRIESRIGDEDGNVREAAILTLKKITPHLTENNSLKREAMKDLERMEAGRQEKEMAFLRFVYTHSSALSPGALLALSLLGREMLKGDVGTLTSIAPLDNNRYRLNSVAERLKELAQNWRDSEALLKGYLTLGGKIRGVEEMSRYGYRSGPGALVAEEGVPVILEPVRDPSILVQTIEELVYLDSKTTSLPFKVSLTLSGQVEDDLRYAALGVHSLLTIPFSFPDHIKSLSQNLRHFENDVSDSEM